MTNLEVAYQRLYNQHLADTTFETSNEVVQWLGAIQAQDYGGAKWAVAQRTTGLTDAALDQAFAEGTILRTHVLRPTWHFVTSADICWMLKLTAPRVNALNAYWYRKLELDEAVFTRSNNALIKALQNGTQLTRSELVVVLQQAGIATHDLLRFNYLMIRAELDAVVCSGALRGKQHTYALLDERAPRTKKMERDEALAELGKRYFTSRGPATLKDYIWWSGLAAADAKVSLEMIKSQFIQESIDGQTYWFPASSSPEKDLSKKAYLLPNYDEYIVGYTDRSAIFDSSHLKNLDSRGNPLFNYTILLNGQIVGTWKRSINKNTFVIEANPFTPLDEIVSRAFAFAAEDYGRFLGLPVIISGN